MVAPPVQVALSGRIAGIGPRPLARNASMRQGTVTSVADLSSPPSVTITRAAPVEGSIRNPRTAGPTTLISSRPGSSSTSSGFGLRGSSSSNHSVDQLTGPPERSIVPRRSIWVVPETHRSDPAGESPSS